MAVPTRVLAAVALAVGVAAAYSNSLHAPFVFDDWGAVVRNPTLHSLWPPGAVLRPPAGGFTPTGRPLLNLTLALNYAAGGLNPAGYHAVNAAIHLLAALTLFGWLRRTWTEAADALPLAFTAALIWALHPLQTESVTYISQRAESQMGLCYLLTLYGFRVASDRRDRRWLVVSFLSCLAGMATKEVMASAPVMVLAYDRAFVAGSFAAAWRERKAYYGALAATWLVLAAEVASGQSRGGTVGFGLGISWAHYLYVQCSGLLHYLQLAIWPKPLVFDYGLAGAFQPAAVGILAAALVGVLIIATAWACVRRPQIGFWGRWFFAILAPTSLVPGNRQTWAEHRMYLALVPVAVAVAAAWLVLRAGRRSAGPGVRHENWGGFRCGVLGAGGIILGVLTWIRNEDYGSAQRLWADTAAKRPENAFAQYNWGEEALRAKRYPEAEAALRRALALKADYAEAHNNLGTVLTQTGQAEGARAEFAAAARLKPGDAEIRNNWGNALLAAGRWEEAAAQYRAAIAADATLAAPHRGLAEAELRRRDLSGAATEFRAALRLEPADPALHDQLAAILLEIGQPDAAMREFAEAVRVAPGDAPAHFNWGNALAQQRRFAEAEAQYRAALAIDPTDALVHYNLGTALMLSNRIAEARAQYAEALRLKPDFAKARDRLQLLEFR